MPRTISSISVPAREASYNASIISASTRLFIFITMRPSGAFASWWINSRSRDRRLTGATQDPPVGLLWLYPVR